MKGSAFFLKARRGPQLTELYPGHNVGSQTSSGAACAVGCARHKRAAFAPLIAGTAY